MTNDNDFRLLVESVRDYAIFMLDPQCRVISWNAGAERMKGYSEAEVLGKHFSIFYPPEDARTGIPEIAIARALLEGRIEEEGWRLRKDGTRFWASAVITTVYAKGHRHVGFAKVTRDLTERRRAEQDRLELAKAGEALRLREDFLSIASHELRTPLNALSLYLQAAKRSAETGAQSTILLTLEKALGQSHRLSELITGLLDASRITEGKLTLYRDPVELVAAVGEAVDQFRGIAASAGVEIRFTGCEPAVGSFDRLRIEQLVTNLLENALKYGRGGPIDVATTSDGSAATIAITDRGIGIAPENLARVFERFERATSSRHFGGLGLGLYIAQSIAAAHGGTISVESVVGEGSTFRVRLPIGP